MRSRAKQMFAGIDFHLNDRSAMQASNEERQREYEGRWAYGGVTFMGAFNDLLFDEGSNATAAEFVRHKIHEIVRDPALAEALSPRYVIGCKRLCVDTGYYDTFNRANVSLVDLSKSPIEAIVPGGLLAGGRAYEFDSLVLATGFDAMTGALTRIDVRGKAGHALRDKWHGGPRAYLGLMIAGFPNLFTITGPGSPSVLTNMLPSIEQHVDWIADCLAYLRSRGMTQIEATWKQRTNGSRTSTRWREPICARRAAPGMSARMFQASRAFSCLTSAAFPRTCKDAAKSSLPAIGALP